MEKTKFEVYIEEKTQNYGKIFLEPLERGYGDTLGNALRRLLLSSIRGAAVTAVRIDGVLHEFSTIKGIREDVIEILMNLKQIPIKAKHDKADEGFKIITLDSDFLPKNFFTRKENPGVITAADLPKDNDFEFCGDNILCTLEPDAHLLMEIYVEQGVGYLSSERERPAEPSLPIDALLTDAIFSPVKRVNYQIEPARVGKSIDYERLVLEVWTNGAITPEEAVKQASEIAEKCFNKVSETVLTAKEKEREKIEIPSVPKGRPCPISEIGLTVRAANCLLRGGIATLQDLLDRSHEDLLKLRNLGKKSLKEIEEKVEDLGYVLAPSPEIEETEAQPEEVKQEVKEAAEFSSKKDPKELLADIFIDSDNAVQEAEDLIKAKNKEEEKPAKEPTKKPAKSTRVKKSDKSDVKAEEVKEEKVEVKEEPKEPETEAKSAKKKTSRSKKSEKTESKVEEVKEEVKEEIKEPETEAKTEKKKSSRSKKSEKSDVKAEEVKEVKEVKETKKEKAAKTAKGKAKKEVEEVKEEVKKPEPEPEAKVEKVEAETEAKPEKKKSSRSKKSEKSDVKAEEVKEVKKVKEAKAKKEKATVKEEKSEKPEKTEKPAKTKATKTKKAAESDSDKKKSASKSKTAKTKKEKDRKEGA